MPLMKKSVTVIDDTLKRNVCVLVTDANIAEIQKVLGFFPVKVGMYLPMKNKGKQVQEDVQVKHTFEGLALDNAILRAKRWLRKHGRAKGVPGHIALKLMAYAKADPKGFKADAMA